MSKVVVIAVHPDDETLGCGGTLLKHKKKGDEIYWVIVTSIQEKYGFKKDRILIRDQEIKMVSEKYGFNKVFQLGLPTIHLDEIPKKELIDKISNIFHDIKPDVLYIPFNNDAHSDHHIVFDAAFSCTKTFRFPYIKRVLMMETISETEFCLSLKDHAFTPNYFVNISEHLEDKLNIMDVYKSELGNHPFPRSKRNIRALATFRGAMANCEYAESFVLLKEIIR